MKRVLLILFIITTFIFIVSCGLPYAFEIRTTDYTITSNPSESTATITLKNEAIDPAQINRNNYPILHLLYIVSSNEATGKDKKITEAFNKIYSPSNINSHQRLTYDDEALAVYDTSEEWGIFTLREINGQQIDKYLLDSNNTWKLDFEIDPENYLSVTVNDDPGQVLRFGRCVLEGNIPKAFENDADFAGNEVPLALYDPLIDKSFNVDVYAVISFDFVNYTNLYNTKVSKAIYSF